MSQYPIEGFKAYELAMVEFIDLVINELSQLFVLFRASSWLKKRSADCHFFQQQEGTSEHKMPTVNE